MTEQDKDKYFWVSFVIISVILIYITLNINISRQKYSAKQNINRSIKNEHNKRYYMNKIPKSVSRLLKIYNWKYVFVDDKKINHISRKYGYHQAILGLSVYNDHIIYASKNDKSVVLHETFHALDSIFYFPSKSKEATHIYKKEQNKFLNAFKDISKINTSLQVEYFAEAFQEYLLEKDKLKEECPKTYMFLHRIIKRCDDMSVQ